MTSDHIDSMKQRKYLHRNMIQFHEHCFGPAPFHCFGPPIWLPRHYVEMIYKDECGIKPEPHWFKARSLATPNPAHMAAISLLAPLT